MVRISVNSVWAGGVFDLEKEEERLDRDRHQYFRVSGLPAAHTYTAAKRAAINLTRSIAITYCNDGIRANCIAPGLVKVPMVESVLSLFGDPVMADKLSPNEAPGDSRGDGYGCLYFASDKSTYCQGSVLMIDGGTTGRQ